MGKRSRKRRPDGTPISPPAATPVATAPERTPSAPPTVPTPEMSKSERRNAEARANLEPLAEGERPGAVTVAAIVAILLAAANIVLWAIGTEVQGEDVGPSGVFIFAALMLFAAWGMWRAKYWAVLGFQALLAVTVTIASLSLMVASNWRAVILCLAIIGLGGWLFWKLIRAMARIQMPKYQSR